MTEILTESFCERCGTRYTFEAVGARGQRLSGLRILGRGLKTFVMADDTSLDEALAGARSDQEREVASRQLDAFHKTFNFCMSCRQYTCANCWNDGEARCLSCAPRQEDVPAAAAFALGSASAVVLPPLLDGADHVHHGFDHPDLAATASAAAAQTTSMLGRFRPGTSLDAEIAAYEAEAAARGVEAAPTEMVMEAAPPEVTVAPAAAKVEPEPVVAEAIAAEAIAAEPPSVEPVAAEARRDVAEQPLWQAPATPTNGDAEAPSWPTGPRWPTAIPARPAPPRPNAPTAGSTAADADPLAFLTVRRAGDAMWAASAQNVVRPAPEATATATVRPCLSCGLSLSATARFCRRCGTRQEG